MPARRYLSRRREREAERGSTALWRGARAFDFYEVELLKGKKEVGMRMQAGTWHVQDSLICMQRIKN